MEIIPVINKIDLPSADVDRVKAQIEKDLGLDPDTAGHSARVSRLAEVVARRMDQDVFGAALAGLLHDLGKVHLPQSVLKSKRRLTPAERLLLQDHVQGAESLARLVAGNADAPR